MWKAVAPLLTGVSLFLIAPAPATEKADQKPREDLVVRTVTLKGMLRHVTGDKMRDPPIPFEYWELHSGGKTYYLDLRGKQLLELAEQLVNRPVAVTGIPEPASPTIRVTSLRA